MSTYAHFYNLGLALEYLGADDAIKALGTVAGNLAARPFDERVRTLRVSNEAVKRKILAHPPAVDFLRALGFVEVEGFLSVAGDVGGAAREARAALAALPSQSCSIHDGTAAASATLPLAAASRATAAPAASAAAAASDDRGLGRLRLRRPPPGAARVSSPIATWQVGPSPLHTRQTRARTCKPFHVPLSAPPFPIAVMALRQSGELLIFPSATIWPAITPSPPRAATSLAPSGGALRTWRGSQP